MAKSKYSKEQFFNEIIRIYNIEQNININLWNKYTIMTDINFEYYVNKFGGIRKICNELGLKQSKNKLSDKDMIYKALELYNQYGYLTKDLYSKYGYSSCAVRQHFGSYTNFFKLLDIPLNVIYEATPEEIKEDVYNFCINNETTKSTLYRKYGKYSQKVIDDTFGGWTNLIEELKLNPCKKNYGLDFMNDYIQKLYNEYGYLTIKLIQDNCPFSYQALRFHYDSIEKISLIASQGLKNNVFKINRSQGESIIASILSSLNEDFIEQKTFDWLRNPETNHMLYCDFYIERLNLVIEYNGRQHYEFIPYFHKSIEEFESDKKRDELKKKILNDNNIKVITIPYYEKLTIEYLKELLCLN